MKLPWPFRYSVFLRACLEPPDYFEPAPPFLFACEMILWACLSSCLTTVILWLVMQCLGLPLPWHQQ